MKPIFISLSPNTEPDDIHRTWRVLLSPRSWFNQSYVQKLEKALSNRFTGHEVVAVSSGRTALYEILRAANIGEGDEVIVQAFTCLAVPAAVTWAKAQPVFADIEADGYNLSLDSVRQRVTPKTKALVVQHTFGYPADIDAVRTFASERGLLLIEDLAHAFGSSYKGKPLGTFGDVAFISFGRDKTISSIFGGAVVTNDAAFAQRIRDRERAKPLPSIFWIKQQLLHPLLISFVKRTYFTGNFGKALLVLAQKLHVLSKAVSVRERTGEAPSFIAKRYSPALAQLALHQLTRLDSFIERRRAIAQHYTRELSGSATLSDGTSPLRWPMRVSKPKDVLKQARAQKMLLGDWYDQPVVPCSSDACKSIVGYVPGSCPNAESAAHFTINLPTYPTMTATQVANVISFIRLHGG